MIRHYLIAAGLLAAFTGLIVIQLALSADVKNDRQITVDLREIEDVLREELREENEKPGVSVITPGSQPSTQAGSRLENITLPALSELDLDDDLQQRALASSYELNYPDDADQTTRTVVAELCAVFRTDTVRGNEKDSYDDYSYDSHSAGRHCFKRDIY